MTTPTDVRTALIERASHAIKALRGSDYRALCSQYIVAQSLAEIIEQLLAALPQGAVEAGEPGASPDLDALPTDKYAVDDPWHRPDLDAGFPRRYATSKELCEMEELNAPCTLPPPERREGE